MPKLYALSLYSLIFLVLFGCGEKENIQREREMHLLNLYLQQNGITQKPLASGLYYIPVLDGTGLKAERGDYVIILYTGQLIDGRVFDTTNEQLAITKGIHSNSVLYGPSKFKLENLNIKGMEEGIKLMREGGKARLIIPSNLGYGSKGIQSVPAYSTLIYDIELIKVIKNPVEYEAQELQAHVSLYRDSTHLNLTSQIHNTGNLNFEWYYIEIAEGTGDSIAGAQRVFIHYQGQLLDGRVFDSNFGKPPFRFTVGERNVVIGMELGVKKMKKNGKARIIIPSALAYGEKGTQKIPPYSPLVFDIVVENVEK